MDSEIKHSGISNPGNQCYFNSMMQALASCSSIYEIIKSRQTIDDKVLSVIRKYNLIEIELEELRAKTIFYTSDNPDQEETEILHKIGSNPTDLYIFMDWRNIMKGLINKKYAATLEIGNLVSMLRTKVNVQAFRDLFSGSQCDPHEALVFLLELVHRFCSKPVASQSIASLEPSDVPQGTHQDHIIPLGIPDLPSQIQQQYNAYFMREYATKYSEFVQHFHNTYLSTVKCRACNHAVYNISPLGVIDIPLPMDGLSYVNLIDSIARFFSIEPVENYKCDSCNSVNTSTMSKNLLTNAKTLIIELKRFIQIGDKLAKNNIPVIFPSVFEITGCLVDKRKPARYYLTAVIVHASAHMGFGHYYCVSRKVGTDKWFICDDSRITPVSIDDALKQHGAYLLFYTMIQ
jgi:ubiquitin C-terminal hydrolase